MYLVASIRQFVCALLAEPFDLDFWHGVDLDLEYAGIVGQCRRSKVKVKCQKSCFDFTVTLL